MKYKKLDLPQDIAEDYSADEKEILLDVVNNSGDLASCLEVVEFHTNEHGQTNYGILQNIDLCPNELSITQDNSGYRFFERK